MFAPIVETLEENIILTEEEILSLQENAERLKGHDKILSYKSIYSGDMYNFITFSDNAHASVSNMIKLNNGDFAIIHIEDGKGAYQDMYYPSYKVINKKGKSEVLSRLIKHAHGAKEPLGQLIKKRRKALNK